jgi:maleylpyruvate isomerase
MPQRLPYGDAMSTRTAAARPDATLGWVARGTIAFENAVRDLGDDELTGPSHLPGWTRAHVIAHVARNADALGNLIAWARTGVETPMYASPEQRNRDIDEGSVRAPAEIRADLVAADGRLADAFALLPDDRWGAEVRTAHGRLIPASGVAWLRTREVWIHGVDLNAGMTFDDVPRDVCVALLDDIAAAFATRPNVPPVELQAEDAAERTWTLGSGDKGGPAVVTGDIASLTAYLTGRPAPRPLHTAGGEPAPALPAWL